MDLKLKTHLGKLHGFTLAEMMLVIFLVILLTATALTGIIRSQQSFIFAAADQQVQAIVREARSLAVTGKAQPDYTDFDGDGCKHANNHDIAECPPSVLGPTEDDYVTPANYGIYFDMGSAQQRITLFADIHQANGSLHNDGQFDDPGVAADIGSYIDGKDVVLLRYDIPSSLSLILDPENAGHTYTVLYSPIFADVTFDDGGTGNLPALFFKYGIEETNGSRNRCMVIHPISGVPELLETVSSTDTCP